MALNPRTRGPRRALLSLLAILIVLYGAVFAVHQWGSGQVTPKLGLDLEGGTQMVLQPVLADPNADVSAGQLDKARDIIAQRVDSNGVAEAEVTTQGGRNIVVSIPGQPDPKTLDAIRKPSQLRFRPVLVAAPGTPTPTDTQTGTATSSGAAATPTPRRRPGADDTGTHNTGSGLHHGTGTEHLGERCHPACAHPGRHPRTGRGHLGAHPVADRVSDRDAPERQ